MLTWHQHLSEQILPKPKAVLTFSGPRPLWTIGNFGEFISHSRLDPYLVEIPVTLLSSLGAVHYCQHFDLRWTQIDFPRYVVSPVKMIADKKVIGFSTDLSWLSPIRQVSGAKNVVGDNRSASTFMGGGGSKILIIIITFFRAGFSKPALILAPRVFYSSITLHNPTPALMNSLNSCLQSYKGEGGVRKLW